MASARVLNRRPNTQDGKPSRGEFLYYVWGASIALLLGGTGAELTWYMLPRANPDETVTWQLDNLPPIGSTALVKPELVNQWSRRFSLAHPDNDSLIALYHVCPYDHCLVRWLRLDHWYECWCCGSKFHLGGLYIEGPAPRSLDRYYMTITFTDGTTATTNDAGDPIPPNGRAIASVTVDTRQLIQRAGRV